MVYVSPPLVVSPVGVSSLPPLAREGGCSWSVIMSGCLPDSLHDGRRVPGGVRGAAGCRGDLSGAGHEETVVDLRPSGTFRNAGRCGALSDAFGNYSFAGNYLSRIIKSRPGRTPL